MALLDQLIASLTYKKKKEDEAKKALSSIITAQSSTPTKGLVQQLTDMASSNSAQNKSSQKQLNPLDLINTLVKAKTLNVPGVGLPTPGFSINELKENATKSLNAYGQSQLDFLKASEKKRMGIPLTSNEEEAYTSGITNVVLATPTASGKALRSAKGQFTNVRELDNPLLKGKSWIQNAQKNLSKITKLQGTEENIRSKDFLDEMKSLQRDIDFKPQTPVTKKVNVLDYWRTPDRVLEKIGLKPEMDYLRAQHEKYLAELPQEIERIANWAKQVPASSNRRIFRYLDGQGTVLNAKEREVALQIKGYFSDWANKLKLPQEKRITNYVTRIFEPDLIKKEFDEDLAKLISGKVAGSTYNPFTQKRTGGVGYKEDVWQALQAYAKRAVRSFNYDPALSKLKEKSVDLEKSQLDYLTKFTESINMRPTDTDNLIDNWIKSSPVGYKFGQRPVMNISQGLRQTVFRGTLGGNVGSALRNLSQAANTYSVLGEKWTAKGYFDLARNYLDDELQRVGVLSDSFIQDKQLSATKKTLQKIDEGLFFLFNQAEKINRGSAYYGAKAQALSKGMNEKDAIDYAKEMVRKSQFSFGKIDTPLALQSDINKTLLQFMSYPIKQTEFIAEKIKNKELAGIVRYIGATAALVHGYKQLGLNLDVIPFQSIISGEQNIAEPPPVQLAKGLGKLAFGAGDERTRGEAIQELTKAGRAFIPGGVQGFKSAEGLLAFLQGKSTTPTGKTRFYVPQDPGTLAKTVAFGQYSIPEGQAYIESGFKTIPKAQEELDRLKKMPKEKANEEARKIKEKNPSLYGAIKSLKEDEETGISETEKEIRNLQVYDYSRTNAIVEKLNTLKTNEEKNKLINDWRKKRIITDQVFKQLKELKSNGQI